MADIDDWLADGDAPEADWAVRITQLALAGDLGRAGPRLLLDLGALLQPHACRPAECTPGMRAPRTRSCCADLQVTLAPREIAAIEAVIPDVAARSEDPRWAAGTPAWRDGDTLTKPGKRCIFAEPTPTGLRCALHRLEDETGRPRGSVKPMPCRLFPLVVIDLGDGRRLLTAVHRTTARMVGAGSAAAYPCLRRDASRPPLFAEERDTIEALFGPKAYAALEKAAMLRGCATPHSPPPSS